METGRNRITLYGSLLFLFVFSIYLVFLCPTIAAGDTAELITVAATLGVAHPPGYPLFTMLGKLFTLIPLKSVAWRVNIMAACAQALAVLFLFLSLMKITKSPAASCAGAASLAFSRVFWHYAEVAEVFSLNNLFASVLLYLLLVLREEAQKQPASRRRKKGQAETGAPKVFYLFFFFSGLALTNHHTIILLVPAVLYFLWTLREPLAFSLRKIAFALLFFVLGMLPYVYLPLAAMHRPAINWDDPVTIRGFSHLLLREDYGSLSLFSKARNPHPPALEKRIYYYGRSLLLDFAVAGFLLGLLGIYALRRDGSVNIFLLVAFFFTGPFFALLANMPLENPLLRNALERFYMLSEVFYAVWIGVGVSFMLKKREGRSPAMTQALAALVVVILAVLPFMCHRREADFSRNDVALRYGRDLLACTPPGALLFMRSDAATMSVDYLQLVEHERGDVKALDQEKLTYAWYSRLAQERYPDLVIPGERYDGVKVRNIDLYEANKGKGPVLFSEFMETSYQERFDSLPRGLLRRLVPRGEPVNLESLEKENMPLFEGFMIKHAASQYPKGSFERDICRMYGLAYFNMAYEFDRGGDLEKAERFYRTALEMAPDHAPTYKNLGILYYYKKNDQAKGRDLLREYMRLNPEDPDGVKIQGLLGK
jgi:hypothetical protein